MSFNLSVSCRLQNIMRERMPEIEDRGLRFKSYKKYAQFLRTEVQQLQQLLPSEKVERAFLGAVKRKYYVQET